MAENLEKYLDFDGLKDYDAKIKDYVDKADEKGKSDVTALEGRVDTIESTLDDKVSSTRKVNNKALSADITLSASDVGAIAATAKGAVNGVAELDSTGKVPSGQLPSYVDDVIEGYLSGGKFYEEEAHTTEIAGESGKIYVDLATNKVYRWSGTAFTVISDTIALGETASTAYRGDRGKTAYDHSQSAHAPSNAERNSVVGVQKNGTDLTPDSNRKVNVVVPTKVSELSNDSGFTKVEKSTTSGNVKIDGTETVVYTHPTTAGSKHIPTGGAANQVLEYSATGTAKWGHTVQSNVPADAKFTDTTYSAATTTVDGLMSAADKTKLDNITTITTEEINALFA